VPYILEQEGGSSGKRANHYVRTQLASIQQVIDVPSTKNKLTRAMPFAKSAAAGRVAILRNFAVAEFLSEVVGFTGVEKSEQDDQVDAASLAHNWLFRASGSNVYGSSRPS
jgi:predicted phage terminase large subunit-like protein